MNVRLVLKRKESTDTCTVVRGYMYVQLEASLVYASITTHLPRMVWCSSNTLPAPLNMSIIDGARLSAIDIGRDPIPAAAADDDAAVPLELASPGTSTKRISTVTLSELFILDWWSRYCRVVDVVPCVSVDAVVAPATDDAVVP